MNKEIEVPVKVKVKGRKEGIKVTFKSKVGSDQAIPLADSLIEEMKKGGYEILEPTPATESKEIEKESESVIPICPIHNKELVQRKGQYGMFWTCPTKLENGEWCPWKPPKEKKK